MKKGIKSFAMAAVIMVVLSSCYSYTSVVGSGAQGSSETKEWNHYILFGLAPVGLSDSKQMAGGAENYEVTTKTTFINGLLAGLTFSLYTPTTTIVKK
ncbi:MAG: Bor family protein [Bacteroidota bacterium]